LRLPALGNASTVIVALGYKRSFPLLFGHVALLVAYCAMKLSDIDSKFAPGFLKAAGRLVWTP
jgi:hypothetical protein